MLTLPSESFLRTKLNDYSTAVFALSILAVLCLVDACYSKHDLFAFGVGAGAAVIAIICCGIASRYYVLVREFKKPLPATQLLQLTDYTTELKHVVLPSTGIQTPYHLAHVLRHVKKIRQDKQVASVTAILATIIKK